MLPFLSIILLVFISAAEIDICVASLPKIQAEFKISTFYTEFILGANLITHAIFAFLAGIIGRKYGKRKSINFGMIVFIVSSLICYTSTSYYHIILGRIIQGAGAAIPAVLAPLFIFSIFEKKKQENMMSKLNGICTLGIASAPIIGSIIASYSDWRFNFLFLAIFGVVSQVVFNIFIKNEESDKELNSDILADLKKIIFSKITTILILTCSIAIASYYSFVGMSSIIYIEALGLSLKNFGFYQATSVLAFGLFSILNGDIVRKIGVKNMSILSIALISIFLIGISIFMIFSLKSTLLLLFLMVIWAIGAVYPVNVLYVKSMHSMPALSSIISGLITIFKWIFSIIGFQTASYFYTKSFTSTGVIIIIFYTIVGFGYYFLRKNKIV